MQYPKDFRGYYKGDLLYFSTPPLQDGKYVFKPKIVTYSVDAKSDMGKRIGESPTGVVIHRLMDEQGKESRYLKVRLNLLKVKMYL